MSAYRRRVAALLGVLLVSAGPAACSKEDGPEVALDQFLAAWPTGNLSAVSFVKPGGEALVWNAVADELKALEGKLNNPPPALKRTNISADGDNATGEVAVSRQLPGGQKWDYPTTVKLSKGKDNWRVVWEPKVVHAELHADEHIELRKLTSARAPVLDAKGAEIFKLRPVVDVSVHPARVTNVDAFLTDLGAVFKASPKTSNIGVVEYKSQIVNATNKDLAIFVVTLRREDFESVADGLRALKPQVVLNEDQRMLPPTRGFARALLGSVGSVTKEIIDESKGFYVAGDQAGVDGLQRRYDERLRGMPGYKIVGTRKATDGTWQDRTLHTIGAVAGQPLKTTLDAKIQDAADRALAGLPAGLRGSLVAIRISDGSVVATANSTNENIAFTGQVPPGSTFKVVTALGALDGGKVTADQIVGCPKTSVVNGQTIRNSHDMALGNVPFHVDFAKSCNTAFVDVGLKLGADGLNQAASSVGLGKTWEVGTNVFGGKVSQGATQNELAAASYGQGTTVVSPISMAGVAAAVARGQWKQPIVLIDPKALNLPDATALKPAAVEPLRLMMREVVQSGTATQLLSIPGAAVYGKTGTAEYDNNPDHTHAWFIGYQADIAFAVFVEKGGSPSQTAVPVTSAFLRSIQ